MERKAYLNPHNSVNDIAIFDLDKTITRNDTYVQFLLSILSKKPLRAFRCIHLPFAVLMFKFGLRGNSWLKETFLAAFAGGLSRNEIRKLSESFTAKVLQDGVYQEALDQIAKHRAKGDRLILASASFNFYIDLLAAQLKFDDVLCTQAHWNNKDQLSGRILGDNCYGENKLKAVQKHLSTLEGKRQITMYSDHDSDLPVFLLSDVRIATNPNSRLEAIADSHNISIVRWQ